MILILTLSCEEPKKKQCFNDVYYFRIHLKNVLKLNTFCAATLFAPTIEMACINLSRISNFFTNFRLNIFLQSFSFVNRILYPLRRKMCSYRKTFVLPDVFGFAVVWIFCH